MEVEDQDVSYEQLGVKGKFGSIDAKLAAAISKIQTGVLGRKLTRMNTEAAKNITKKKNAHGDARPFIVSGRQLLRIIYDRYHIDRDNGKLYDVEDLMALKYPGDRFLETFITTWDDTLALLEEDPAEEVKRSIFHRLVENCGKITDELARYQMEKKGDYCRTYDFLHQADRRVVDVEICEENREEIVRAKNKVADFKGKPAAPATEDSTTEDGGK